MRQTKDRFALPESLVGSGNSAVLYAKFYLLIRATLGLIGVLFPMVLVVGEAHRRGSVHVRGSLSNYYHSSMRDIFVGSLCVTGVLLATYMAKHWRTRDFFVNLVAGVAVLGVVFCPTSRPGLTDHSPRCGTTPMPVGCSPVQQQLGEIRTAEIHSACAIVFVSSLAAIAFVLAYREKQWNRSRAAWLTQVACGGVVIAAAAGVGIGELLRLSFGELTPLYVGEVVSIWAIGISLLLAARDLLCRLSPAQRMSTEGYAG